MERKASQILVVILTILLSTSIVVLFPSVAVASTDAPAPSYCHNNVGVSLRDKSYHPFGSDIPIILVHGMGGKGARQWGDLARSSDFTSKLDTIDGVSVAAEFEYNTVGPGDISFQDHPRPLAQVIDCMAEISRRNSGPGKVIVVGYSEGAAIARKALKLSVDGRVIADEVGQVVTIADASHFFPAPKITDTVTVHAIAGNILVQRYDKNGNPGKLRDTKSDDTIRAKWATWQYSDNISQGGGSTIVECTETKGGGKSQIPLSDTSCHHGALLNNSRVQNATIGAVTRYASFLIPTSEQPHRVWTHSGLTLRLPDNQWDEIISAFGDPSINGTSNELGTTRELMLLPFSDFCTSDPSPNCRFNPNFQRTGPAPSVLIGGRAPDFTTSYVENDQVSTDTWCFSTAGVCVFYRGNFDTNPPQPSQALLDVFAGATWA